MERAEKNCYELLGVGEGVPSAVIKTAFRKQALKHHPDVRQDSSDSLAFILMKNAFDILSDQEKI